MKNEKLRVPKLRFKEFSGEWEEKGIGQVLKIGSGKDYKHLDHGNIPVYGTGGLMTYVNDYLYDGVSVCIGRKGTIDKPMLLSGEFWTVDTLFYTHSFKESIPEFIFSIFQRINWKLYNEASGVPSLSKATIEKVKVNIPKKQEQEKIASFLSSIDKKINQLSKKDELLQNYKKAMMQKIFSQKLRFKKENRSDYRKWEEKKLGDISNIIMGQSPDSKSYNNGGDGIYLIQGNADIEDRKSNPRSWTNEPTKECKVGDLILTVRAPVGAIAKSLHNACIGRGVCVIRNKETSSLEYLYQYLLWFEPRWIALEQGSTFTAVSSSDIKSLKIPFPYLKEQTKIANFLSSLDTKISQNKKALEETQKFKKALLQKMFV